MNLNSSSCSARSCMPEPELFSHMPLQLCAGETPLPCAYSLGGLKHSLWVKLLRFNIRKYNDCTATSTFLSLLLFLPNLFNYKFQKSLELY